MVDSIANLSSAASAASSLTAAASASGISSDPAQAQDRFLKLLVAQLSNQDPMNPMDNAQMTSQMAQINTVTGIQQLNQTVKSLTQQFSSMQLMQGGTLVGREVLSDGNRLTRTDSMASGSIELSAAAASVKVEVLSAGGQVLGSVDLGALPAGRKDFDFNAQTYGSSEQLNFRVVAQNAGQKVDARTLVRDKVTAVGMESGAVSLQLSGNQRIAFSAVAAVL